MQPRQLRALSLVFFGFVLIGFVGGWRVYTSRILSFDSAPQAVAIEVDEGSLPVSIEIPKVKVKVEVEKKSIVNGVWEISGKKASFLDISSPLGTNGNTVIYGHNKNAIFGPIRWLEKGDEIFVKSQDGKIFTFIVEESVVVKPDNISYVEPKSEEVLTLYTCTGFMDAQRHIIVAKPAKSR